VPQKQAFFSPSGISISGAFPKVLQSCVSRGGLLWRGFPPAVFSLVDLASGATFFFPGSLLVSQLHSYRPAEGHRNRTSFLIYSPSFPHQHSATTDLGQQYHSLSTARLRSIRLFDFSPHVCPLHAPCRSLRRPPAPLRIPLFASTLFIIFLVVIDF